MYPSEFHLDKMVVFLSLSRQIFSDLVSTNECLYNNYCQVYTPFLSYFIDQLNRCILMYIYFEYKWISKQIQVIIDTQEHTQNCKVFQQIKIIILCRYIYYCVYIFWYIILYNIFQLLNCFTILGMLLSVNDELICFDIYLYSH